MSEHDAGHDARGHDHTQAVSPEADVARARESLASGDLPHAAFHVGCALAADPQRAEWLALLEEIAARAELPLALAPLGEQAYFATVAVRSRLLARQGEVAEAVGLLLQVAGVKPTVPYLPWAIEWLRQPEVVTRLRLAALREALFEHAIGPLTELLQELPSPLAAGDPRAANAAAAAGIAGILREAEGRGANAAQLAFVHSAYLRRLGQHDAALAVARAAYEAAPSWHTAVGVASAHRDAGDVAQALAAYQQALALDPTELSCHLDMGDMLLAHDRPAEAARQYETVLERDPRHAWAAPALHFARYRATRDPAERDRLLAVARLLPEDQHAEFLVDQVLGELPYVNAFPWPGDPAARVVWQIGEQLGALGAGDDEVLALLQDADEGVRDASPSLATALRLTLEENGLALELRQAGGASRREPPDDETAAAVATLAAGDFRASTWMTAAAGLAEALGPERLPALLGAMHHPPDPPEADHPHDDAAHAHDDGHGHHDLEIPPLIWVRLVQVSAALIIANLERETPWHGSLRREALLALANGPIDWTTDAAIVALAQVALADPAALPEVRRLFAALDAAIPATGFTCYELPLLASWSILPGLAEADRAPLLRRIAALQAAGAEADADVGER